MVATRTTSKKVQFYTGAVSFPVSRKIILDDRVPGTLVSIIWLSDFSGGTGSSVLGPGGEPICTKFIYKVLEGNDTIFRATLGIACTEQDPTAPLRSFAGVTYNDDPPTARVLPSKNTITLMIEAVGRLGGGTNTTDVDLLVEYEVSVPPPSLSIKVVK